MSGFFYLSILKVEEVGESAILNLKNTILLFNIKRKKLFMLN